MIMTSIPLPSTMKVEDSFSERETIGFPHFFYFDPGAISFQGFFGLLQAPHAVPGPSPALLRQLIKTSSVVTSVKCGVSRCQVG